MLIVKTCPDGTVSLLVESPSRQHLHELAHAVEHNQPIPRATQKFLAAAARQILRGEDPVKALELGKPMGRPPEAKITRKQQAIAWSVWNALRRSKPERGRMGRIYARAAERFHCDERHIRACWRKYRRSIEIEVKQREQAIEKMRLTFDELAGGTAAAMLRDQTSVAAAAAAMLCDQVQTAGSVAAALAEVETTMRRELEALVSGTELP